MWFGIGIYVCVSMYVCAHAHTHLECDSLRKFSSRLTSGAERSGSCKGKGHVFFPSVFILWGKSNLSAFQHLKGTASSSHCAANSIGETSGSIFLGHDGGTGYLPCCGFPEACRCRDSSNAFTSRVSEGKRATKWKQSIFIIRWMRIFRKCGLYAWICGNSKNCLLGSKELQWWCGQCFVASYKWPSWERPVWGCMGFRMLVRGSWRSPDGLSPMRSEVPWFLTKRTGEAPLVSNCPKLDPTPQVSPRKLGFIPVSWAASECQILKLSQMKTSNIGYKFTLNLSQTNPVFVPANFYTVV